MEPAVLATSGLSLVLYLNTLTADFAYDDSRAILKNQDILPETPLHQIFLDDFWGTPLKHSGSHKSYRPLCVLTFRMNYFLGGFNPVGYHLVNIILHVIATGLFTHLVKQLTKRTFPTYCAGLLFASHPIHTEAVAGVVGRADIGAAIFFILAILNYIKYCKYRDTNLVLSGRDDAIQYKWYLFLVAMSTAASMLSKEQGVTVLAVCAVYDVFIHHKVKPQDLLNCWTQKKYGGLLEGMVSLAAIGLSLLTFRLYLMGNKAPEFAPADNPASDSHSVTTRLLTFIYLPCLNLVLLLFPWTLSFDWSMEAVPLVESVSDPRNCLTASFWLGLAYVIKCGVTGLHKHSKLSEKANQFHLERSISQKSSHNGGHSTSWRRSRYVRRGSSSSTDSNDDNQNIKSKNRTLDVLLISMAMVVFPFIPASNLFFYVGFVVAERVLYIPSMGFCLLVAYGAFLLQQKYTYTPSRRKLVRFGVGALVLLFSARTVLRNQDWRNEESLYKSGIKVNPAKAWGNLANIFNSQGKIDEAEGAYKNALHHRGNMADVHYNLGILLQEQRRYKEAIKSYQNAIHFRPRLTLAYLNLGIVLGIIGQNQEATRMYQLCSEIDIAGLKDPKLHESTKISALYNLGRLQVEQGHYQAAISTYKLAIERRPGHYGPQSLYNMLGEAYVKKEQLDEAEFWYREALRAKPDHIPAHLTMARLYHKKNDIAQAEKWFKKAMTIDPMDNSVFQHYGQFLSETGHYTEASRYYTRAADALPQEFELIFNAANSLRQAGKNIQAENYYRKAAILKPDAPSAHMNLGAMLHFNNKLEDAEKSYLQALQLKPEDDMTRINLKKLRNLMQSKAVDGRR